MKLNNSKRSRGALPVALSVILGLASAASFIVMYSFTKYLPLLLISFVLMLPMLINAFLLVFSWKPELSSENEEPGTEDSEAPTGIKLFFKKVRRILKKISDFLKKIFLKGSLPATVVLTALSVIGVNVAFWLLTSRITSVYTVSYIVPVVLLVLFVIFIIFEKWCKHTETKSTYFAALLKNIRTAFAISRFSMICVAAAIVTKLIASFDIQRYLVYALWVVFVYETAFTLLSFSVKLIRRELSEDPDVSIPMPFSVGKKNDLGILSYLEKNTGITMRSLWSMRLIRNMIPYTVIIAILLFWLCTGIVQIESDQMGALYRLGKLSDKPLSPGINFTLPWPFDTVEIYNTEAVNKITVGYSSTENMDNTWTGNHGSNEYKLMLGGGNELVSVNIRLEYKIKDLMQYLRSSGSPEKLLEANFIWNYQEEQNQDSAE